MTIRKHGVIMLLVQSYIAIKLRSWISNPGSLNIESRHLIFIVEVNRTLWKIDEWLNPFWGHMKIDILSRRASYHFVLYYTGGQVVCTWKSPVSTCMCVRWPCLYKFYFYIKKSEIISLPCSTHSSSFTSPLHINTTLSTLKQTIPLTLHFYHLLFEYSPA